MKVKNRLFLQSYTLWLNLSLVRLSSTFSSALAFFICQKLNQTLALFGKALMKAALMHTLSFLLRRNSNQSLAFFFEAHDESRSYAEDVPRYGRRVVAYC